MHMRANEMVRKCKKSTLNNNVEFFHILLIELINKLLNTSIAFSLCLREVKYFSSEFNSKR